MPEHVEYDLDNEDEDWLEKYNDGQNRLPAEKLEVMMWKLEIKCGEANDVSMANSAAFAAEKGQIISYADKCAALASTDALPKDKALELLKEEVSGRPAILEAVYNYWVEKRKATGKPCLRRLQPPPAPNDNNPFNVFRQREKTNRPQTRRRRENDQASFEKMRQIRKNMEMVYAIVELELRREEKKMEALQCEIDMQLLQVKLKHEPRTLHEEIEAEFAKRPSAKALTPKELEWDANKPVSLPLSQVEVVLRSDGTYGLGGERYAPQQEKQTGTAGGKNSKKRRREEAMAQALAAKGLDRHGALAGLGGFGPANALGPGALPGSAPPGFVMGPGGILTSPNDTRKPPKGFVPIDVAPYKPPPDIPDIEMIFAANPDVSKLRNFVLPLGMHKQHCRPRVARGGRIVWDRKDPITREPYFDHDGGDGIEGLPADPDEEETQTPKQPSAPFPVRMG